VLKDSNFVEEAHDALTLNIIDREIFEWQYVCRTGRPYWWSPESKHVRLKKLDPRFVHESTSRIWFREVDERPAPDYNSKRRAISDSFLADPTAVDDLAHLIAIQLLGSCFTLPPDHLNGIPSPKYTTFDKNGSPTLPDPRMISSLRLHAHFRYSPCFGHQPRNSSPSQLWPGIYDGPQSCSTSDGDGMQTPVISTSEFYPRRRRAHRALNVTQGSGSSYTGDSPRSQRSDGSNDGPDPLTASYRRQGIDDNNCRKMMISHEVGKIRKRITNSRDASRPSKDQQPAHTQKLNYRLRPVIRSEPHPVFVQPVKELVVRKWNTIRRRFGGSLHAPLPSEGFTSDSAQSEVSSPGLSSDGKARRRRAQERGDIHSNSVESTPHYNSPASGHLSPTEGQYWTDSANTSPRLLLADPLAAAAALAFAEKHTEPLDHHSTPQSLSMPPSPNSLSSQKSSPSAIGNKRPRIDLTSPRFNLASSPPTSRKTQARQRRKSMLSEVHTPDDFADNATNAEADAEVVRSILSAAGSAPNSPKERLEIIMSPRIDSRGHRSMVDGLFDEIDIGDPGPQRLRMLRTSSSGTQLFTPRDQSLELDGLPVGPNRYSRGGKDKRRERTYL